MVTKPRDSLCIVYLGETGFPYGLAPVQRQLLISRALTEAGARVTVISNKGVFSPDLVVDLQPKGFYHGIGYMYTSGETYRRGGFIIRNILKVKGLLNEMTTLTQLKKERDLDAAIVATMRFQSILYYFILSRVLQFKMFLNYVEKSSAIATHRKWRDRINNHLIDRWGICCADAVLPISHYLEEYVKKSCPGKPCLRIPILEDFVEVPRENPVEKYFLYCGSAAYLELIDFIIRAFERLDVQDVYLYLVVNGDSEEMSQYHERIRQSTKQEKIKTFYRLPHNELRAKYMAASGLLIPLRPTIQDEARFPHKIGEYLVSGTPLITTAIGEIKYYFEDGQNAIISSHYDPDQYASKMKFVLDHPGQARAIGEQGRKLGKEVFDFRMHGHRLFHFIRSIIQ